MFSAIGRASFYPLFQLLFQRLELFRLRALFVKRVERVTARYQAVARPGSAIAERAAQPLGSEPGAFDHVQGQVVVGQDHPPQPYEIDLSGADVILPDVREPFLQIGVARSDDERLRIARL